MSYDIVIVHGPNDDTVLPFCVKHLEHVKYARKTFIISHNKNSDVFKNEVFANCVILDESIFPFNKKDVTQILQGVKNRAGWYLQQLLKLYASFVIEDLLDDYVVVDSDTIFLKSIMFKVGQKYIFNISLEYHEPYFRHMIKLHPTFRKLVRESGIAHHMIFNRQILNGLFEQVQTHHQTIFWKAFLQCVDPDHIPHSGASEYEMYFNYMLSSHQDKIYIRKLDFQNTGEEPLVAIQNAPQNCGYISIHHWMRNNLDVELSPFKECDIISGESLQELCDVTIITREIKDFHKSLPHSVKTVFIDGELSENDKTLLDKANNIFVYTHILDRFIEQVLPIITHPFSLMTHNSDHFIDEKYLGLLNDDRLVKMYSQNTHICHPKLIAVPIGIANSQWHHGSKETLMKCSKEWSTNRIEKAFVNFSVGTYYHHRSHVLNVCRNKEVCELSQHNQGNQTGYLDSLTKYKWVVCPRGNGVDTHRLWEAIYSGCIPVVDESINAREFSSLPIILIKDWNDLSLEWLQNETKKLNAKYQVVKESKASLRYWRSQISGEKDGHFVISYIGKLPPYLVNCVEQIRMWNPSKEIYVCYTSQDASNEAMMRCLKRDFNVIDVKIENLKMTDEHRHFNKTYTNLSMNGFWKFTMERFFIVEECMRDFELQNIIHLEADNLVYFSSDKIIDKCKQIDKILIPSDNETRFIAGTCFINRASELRLLNKYFSTMSYNRAEMETIMTFAKENPAVIDCLPVIMDDYPYELKVDEGEKVIDTKKFSRHTNHFEAIFDAAAIGQYLLGIDPIHNRSNTDGFVNPHCAFKINKMWLSWSKVDGKWRLNLSHDLTRWWPIMNLHVHNKSLWRGMSNLAEMTRHLPNIV